MRELLLHGILTCSNEQSNSSRPDLVCGSDSLAVFYNLSLSLLCLACELSLLCLFIFYSITCHRYSSKIYISLHTSFTYISNIFLNCEYIYLCHFIYTVTQTLPNIKWEFWSPFSAACFCHDPKLYDISGQRFIEED